MACEASLVCQRTNICRPGGSGVHWSGHTWRWNDMEFKVRSMYEERYGKKFIPADMTIQDWGITYDEIEPYYDRFERTAAVRPGPARRQFLRVAAFGRVSAAPTQYDPLKRAVCRGR
jgi:gluconate 2-dehydrogenase alpha chain